MKKNEVSYYNDIIDNFQVKKINIKPRTNNWIVRLMDKVNHNWSDYTTVIYKTIYTCKDWNNYTWNDKFIILSHEEEHIKWNTVLKGLLFPFVGLLYLIGNPILLINLLILIPYIEYTAYFTIPISIIASLQGYPFHFRALYEYYGYKKTLESSCKVNNTDIKGMIGLCDFCYEQFVSANYLFMGGFLSGLIKNKFYKYSEGLCLKK